MNADDRTGLLLRERLTDSTAALVARPDTAAQAARGGRRRLRVRHSAFAGMAAALVLAVALPFTPPGALIRQDIAATWQGSGDQYAPLLHASTGGDLAGDEAYRQSVLTRWQDWAYGLGRGVGQDLRSDPVLVWAGQTAAGPAALVVQRTYLPENRGLDPADAGRMSTLVGFIGVDAADEPSLVAYDYWRSTSTGEGIVGWFVDPGRNTLVIRDVGQTLGWNLAEPGRDLQKLTFHRGAVVVGVPKGSDPADVRVHRLPDNADSADIQVAQPLLNPPIGKHRVTTLPGADPSRVAQPHAEFERALLDAGIAVAPEEHPLAATGRVRGNEILIGATGIDSSTHVYGVVLRPGGVTTVIDGGPLQIKEGPAGVFRAGRPHMMRLPDNDGWAVLGLASSLRWRSGAGGWIDVGNPGIVPADATDLEMTALNGHRTVVPLP